MIKIDDVIKEVSSFIDNNGIKVDENIFNLVVALRVNGFNTVNSCEGHVNEKSLKFCPYVGISEEYNGTEMQRYKKNISKLSNLLNLLNLFYSEKKINYKNMLICSCRWGDGGFMELRPNSGLSSAYEIRNLEDRVNLHEEYLKECKDFSEFLISFAKNKKVAI